MCPGCQAETLDTLRVVGSWPWSCAHEGTTAVQRRRPPRKVFPRCSAMTLSTLGVTLGLLSMPSPSTEGELTGHRSWQWRLA